MNLEITQAYNHEEVRLTQEMRKLSCVKQLEEVHRFLYEKGLTEFAKPPKERDKDIADLRSKYSKKLEFNPKSPNDKKKVLYKILGCKRPYN